MPLHDDTADNGRAGRLYVLVVICEVVAITALWLLGRTFR
jgi:hypothetical protein